MRKQLLKLLSQNGRLSTKELAIMLDMPLERIETEIDDLEKEKVILHYGTLINWEKAGEEIVSALIDVKVVPQREVGFDDIAEKIYRFPEVKSVFLMSGGYDLSVMVEGQSLKEVAEFVSERLATLDHIQSTMTHFVLKKFKEGGIILEDGEEDRRQVITP